MSSFHGVEEQSMFTMSRSHDQDDRYAYISKEIWKSFSQEPNSRWPWNLIGIIRDSDSTKLPNLIYSKVKFGHLGFCMEKRQTVDFSEAIIAYDIKCDICNQLHDFL